MPEKNILKLNNAFEFMEQFKIIVVAKAEYDTLLNYVTIKGYPAEYCKKSEASNLRKKAALFGADHIKHCK